MTTPEHLLVVAAMRSELRAFRRHPASAGVASAVVGIGPDRAERGLRHALDERPDIEHVVMIGIAGGVGNHVQIGDLVVPEAVIDERNGTELRPHAFGHHVPQHTLHTSGRFITDRDELDALVARGVVALDMETAAVGAVCEARDLRWSVLRAISDHVDHLPVDPAVLELTGPDGAPRPAAVARYLVTRPYRIPGLVRVARGAGRAYATSTGALVDALS